MTPDAAHAIAERVAHLAADPETLDDLESDGAISPAMARWALSTTSARYVPDALVSLPVPRDLEGRSVALLLAESVPTAPLRAVVLALARGARRVIVRAPRNQERFSARIYHHFAGVFPVKLAADANGREFLARAIALGADTVLAFGSDATLDALQRELPLGVDLEARGHGFGVAIIPENSMDDPAAIAALARDVAHYDQQGCLSPKVILVEGTDTVRIAERLSHALAELGETLPRGRIDPDLAARVHQWQGARAASDLAFFRGKNHALSVLHTPEWIDTPGARNITLAEYGTGEILEPVAKYLTTIGVAGDPRGLKFPRESRARIVAAGTMQDPPLDGYEDPREPFVQLGTKRR